MDDTENASRTDNPVSASQSAIPPVGATKTVTTKDGRSLAYLEVGDPDGPLVIHNHGGPSSRLEARLFANSASKHRLRLICVDRPGMGQSSPQNARTYAGWADDLTTIADVLGYREFGVTGWSEGGPWALAAAAYIDPVRLRHVSSIAGGSYGTFGDNWAAKYLSKADALGGFLALHFTPGFRLMYAALASSPNTSAGLRQTTAESRQRLRSTDFASTGFRNRLLQLDAPNASLKVAAGWFRDAELLYRSWAFDVSKIERRVHMWQGLDDLLVPDPINKQVADRMPGSVWHPVEGAGHFVAIGSGDDLFGIAAEELGG